MTPPLPLHRRLIVFTALTSVALGVTASAFAQSVWSGSSDNEFSNGTNWTPALPGAGDTAIVNDGSPQVTTGATIGELGIDGGNVTISNTGALTVNNGTTVTSGSLGINAGGILNSDVAVDGGSLFIDGDLNGHLALKAGNVAVNGTLGSATVNSATALSINGEVGDVNVSAGGTFVSNTGAKGGALTNAGTASNAGTLASLTNTAGNFTNDNGGTITGKTVVSGGTVTNNFVITDADVAAAAAFVNNNGATAGTVRNSGTTTNAGTIASLENNGGNFVNNNGGTITGKTIVNSGTVTNNFVITDADVAAAAAFMNNTGASAGAVRNSGTVTNAGTVASLQNDGGSFTNNAGGTVTGTTTVNSGSVVNNASLADVKVENQGLLINNNGATVGEVTNSGTVSNDGTVASVLNNDGTFNNTGLISGAATVAGGTLVNDGTISGQIDVLSGGLLAGSGSLGGLSVSAGGVLSPGSGFETLTVNGDVSFHTGSTYQVDIDGTGASDRVDASGSILIDGGTLSIRPASGTYGTENHYAILTGASITGSFDTITNNFAFLSPDLSYGSTRVDLNLMRNDIRFADLATTPADRAAAAAIDTLDSSSPLYLAVLPLDASSATSAFHQLNGEAHSSLKSVILSDSKFVRDAVVDEMNVIPGADAADTTFWASGTVASGRWSSDGDTTGFNSRMNGVVLGATAALGEQWRIGGLFGASHSSMGGGYEAETYHAGLYAAGQIRTVNVTGGAIYANNAVSTGRNVSFASFNDYLSADYTSHTRQVFADISTTFETGQIALQPYVNLAYISLATDGFQENGGAAALGSGDSVNNLGLSTLGVRFSTDIATHEIPISLTGMLGWRHAFGDLRPSTSFSFAGSSPFVIEGMGLPRDALVVRGGLSARLSPAANLTLSYSGEFYQDFSTHAGYVNLSVLF